MAWKSASNQFVSCGQSNAIQTEAAIRGSVWVASLSLATTLLIPRQRLGQSPTEYLSISGPSISSVIGRNVFLWIARSINISVAFRPIS